METNIKPDVLSINTYNRVAQICGGMVAGLGVVAIIGWISGLLLLTSIRSDYIPMGQNTSVAFVVLGCTLFALPYRRSTHFITHWLLKLAVILDLLLGILIITQYLSGINLGVNQVLFSTPGKTFGMVPIGIMSPVTAANFLLTGISIFLLSFPPNNGRRLKGAASILATVVVVIESTVILGYLYGALLLYETRTVPMALTTAIAFVLMGIGLISASGPQYWPLYLMIGPSTRARLMRLFLPVTIVILLFNNWFDAYTMVHWRSNPALMSALLTILTLIIINFIISRMASRIGNPIDHTLIEHNLTKKRFHKLSDTI